MLTARENILYALKIKGVTGKAARREASRMIEAVGLSSRDRARPRELSGGQKQRVAIARALAGPATILLADEPTANLDAQTGAQILDIFRELARRENRAVVIVTHDPKVRRIADRVCSINDGLLTELESDQLQEPSPPILPPVTIAMNGLPTRETNCNHSTHPDSLCRPEDAVTPSELLQPRRVLGCVAPRLPAPPSEPLPTLDRSIEPPVPAANEPIETLPTQTPSPPPNPATVPLVEKTPSPEIVKPIDVVVKALAVPPPTPASTQRIKSPRPRFEPLPEPWNSGDIGSPPLKGSARHAEGIFTINGSGHGIGQGTDAFQFVDRMHKGDGTASTWIEASQNSTAGIMFRATAEPGAAFVGLVHKPGQGLSFRWRNTNGGETIEKNTPEVLPDRRFLKLVRKGNLFTGYTLDRDGNGETEIGSVTVPLRSHVFLGLAVAGGDNNQPASAIFRDVSVH